MGEPRELRGYLKQNPQIKKWFKANKKWFKAHPEVLTSMVSDPSIIKSFNTLHVPPNLKVQPRKKRLFSRIKISALPNINEKLSVTNDLLDNINNFRGIMKELPFSLRPQQRSVKIDKKTDYFMD
jgi:hypothetical protein